MEIVRDHMDRLDYVVVGVESTPRRVLKRRIDYELENKRLVLKTGASLEWVCKYLLTGLDINHKEHLEDLKMFLSQRLPEEHTDSVNVYDRIIEE